MKSLLSYLMLGITGQIAVGAVGLVAEFGFEPTSLAYKASALTGLIYSAKCLQGPKRGPLRGIGQMPGPRVGCSGYLPRSPFLTELVDQIGKRLFGGVIEQLPSQSTVSFYAKPQYLGVGNFSCPMISSTSVFATSCAGSISQRRYSESTTSRGVGAAVIAGVANKVVTGQVYVITVIGNWAGHSGRLRYFTGRNSGATGPTITLSRRTRLPTIALSRRTASPLSRVGLTCGARNHQLFAGSWTLKLGSGGKIRTPDLQVMSLTSYRCSTPLESEYHGTGWFVESPERTHLTFERSIIAPVPPWKVPQQTRAALSDSPYLTPAGSANV